MEIWEQEEQHGFCTKVNRHGHEHGAFSKGDGCPSCEEEGELWLAGLDVRNHGWVLWACLACFVAGLAVGALIHR